MKRARNTGLKSRPKTGETCYFCMQGILEEKSVTVDFRWGNRLVIIENVPAKVCNECGERYYAAKVVRRMEQLAKKGSEEKELRVPVVVWTPPSGETLPG